MFRSGAVRAEKGFTFIFSNEDMDEIIRILESLENSNGLIDGATETVKHEIEKQEDELLATFLAPLPTSLITPVASSLIKGIFKKIGSHED